MSDKFSDFSQDADRLQPFRAGTVSPPFTSSDLHGMAGGRLQYLPSNAVELLSHCNGFAAGAIEELATALDLCGQYGAATVARGFSAKHAIAAAYGVRA